MDSGAFEPSGVLVSIAVVDLHGALAFHCAGHGKNVLWSAASSQTSSHFIPPACTACSQSSLTDCQWLGGMLPWGESTKLPPHLRTQLALFPCLPLFLRVCFSLSLSLSLSLCYSVCLFFLTHSFSLSLFLCLSLFLSPPLVNMYISF